MTEDTSAWVVKDDDREIRFTGRLIGEASSDDGDRLDWTDIKIFRTEAGQFVVHIGARTRRPNGWEKYKTHVSATAVGAVESLHLYDDEDVRYLTNTARIAAEQAAAHDTEFADAYRVQHIA